jgi:uncharacterized protein (TIGR04255 family)
MSHRKYKTPPIQEAVCQFLFDAPLKVDVTLPGRLHGLINSDYDGTPKLLQEQNVAVGEGVNLPPSTQRYQFVSRDGQRILSMVRKA